MFRLCGVGFGVPIQDLDTILRWDGRYTRIPGQPGWQKGVFLRDRKAISLVDLPGLIMPERVNVDGPPPGYLLLVGGACWGLPCDTSQRPRLVRASEVRWNPSRIYRPWSYGILVESLSFLLNIDAVLRKLGTNDA